MQHEPELTTAIIPVRCERPTDSTDVYGYGFVECSDIDAEKWLAQKYKDGLCVESHSCDSRKQAEAALK